MSGLVHNLRAPPRTPAQREVARLALAIRRLIVLQQELLGLREPPRRRAPPAETAAQEDEDAAAGLNPRFLLTSSGG